MVIGGSGNSNFWLQKYGPVGFYGPNRFTLIMLYIPVKIKYIIV